MFFSNVEESKNIFYYEGKRELSLRRKWSVVCSWWSSRPQQNFYNKTTNNEETI